MRDHYEDNRVKGMYNYNIYCWALQDEFKRTSVYSEEKVKYYLG